MKCKRKQYTKKASQSSMFNFASAINSLNKKILNENIKKPTPNHAIVESKELIH